MTTPITDGERLAFLTVLDNAAFEVSDWEASFIASQIKFSTGAILMSDGQRRVCDRMWCKYGPRLQRATAAPTLAERLPAALPEQCAWLERRQAAAAQTRCGQPVQPGKNLCPEHTAERAEMLAKLRKSIAPRA